MSCKCTSDGRSLNQQIAETVGKLFAEPRHEPLAHNLEILDMTDELEDRERNELVFEGLVIPLDSRQIDDLLNRAQSVQPEADCGFGLVGRQGRGDASLQFSNLVFEL